MRSGCAGPDAVAPVARPRSERFEDSDRWARGLAEERRERALAGLERDGLIVRDAAGAPSLP